MSGYKQTIFNDNAISFWSMDGDSIDVGNGLLNSVDMTIIDEVNNENPAILHVEHEYAPHGYRIGLQGLVELEHQDQSSICFGYYNNNIKAFLEIPHSSTYMFPNFGSFSVEFLMKKQNENTFANSLGYGYSITRPIFLKTGVCSMTYQFAQASGQRFLFTFPSGNEVILSGNDIIDKIKHIVLVWQVSKMTDTIYQGIERIMIDGKIYHEYTNTYNGTFPNTNINNSWFFGGNLTTPDSNYNDRNTSPLYLDQIAVYNTGLSKEKIINHYKKIYSYDNMILNDGAIKYYPLREMNDINNWDIENYTNLGDKGVYYGTLETIDRGHDASDLILEGGNVSPLFKGNSLGYFLKTNGYGSIESWININNVDYSLEFWFKTSEPNIGTLLAFNSDIPPFKGIEITINERDNIYRNGGIQVNESGNILNSLDRKIVDNSIIMLNDGYWHHILYQRKTNTLELWLDGQLQDSKTGITYSNITFGGTLYIMGNKIRNKYVKGQISKIAIYNFALQSQQIQARYTYSKLYRIKGIITIYGIPTKATIRIMDNLTGFLIGETASDSRTGYYEYDLPNNNRIDIIVFDRTNPAVRYRAYGAIVPSGENDFPITI